MQGTFETIFGMYAETLNTVDYVDYRKNNDETPKEVQDQENEQKRTD